jgi:hypothetical protein
MSVRGVLVATALAAIVAVGASGCGNESGASESAKTPPATAPIADEQRPQVDVSATRMTADYDYEPAPSVSDLAQSRASVVLGEVAGWSDGRVLLESDDPGFQDFSYTAVLTLEVTRSYRGDDKQGDVVYVEIPRGGEIRVDGELPDNGTEPVLSTIEDLTEAVPTGTRLLLLGGPARSGAELLADSPDSEVLQPGTGYPDGAPLLVPHVQGLLFENETGDFVSGLTDDEDERGWLPPGAAPSSGFERLIQELDSMA